MSGGSSDDARCPHSAACARHCCEVGREGGGTSHRPCTARARECATAAASATPLLDSLASDSALLSAAAPSSSSASLGRSPALVTQHARDAR